MTITIAPDARHVIDAWLSADPSRPALRLSFAGGCGALGYRLATAEIAGRTGEETFVVDGLTVHADYKAARDIDGARIEIGDSPDDVIVVHEQSIVNGWY
jgi:hypothetical protein